MGAELAVVVLAHVGLPEVLLVVPGIAAERGLHVAIGLRVRRVARHVLRKIFDTGDRRSRAHHDVVLPRELWLAGGESARKRAAYFLVVRALAEPHQAFPRLVDLVRAIDRISGERLVIDVIRGRTIVEVRLADALENGEAELVPLGELVGKFRRHVFVAIRVAVGIVDAEGGARLRGVEALGVEIADIDAQVSGTERAADAGTDAARAVAADASAGARRGRVLPSLGEHLDHAADRVRPVEAAQLAGNDFDALDLGERNVLERSGAGGGRAYAHAVYEHERMARIRAAHEHARRLTEAAGARHFDAAQGLQDFNERLLAALRDVLRRDDSDRLQSLGTWLRKPRGGHDDGIVLCSGGKHEPGGEDAGDGAQHVKPFWRRPRRPSG